MPQFRTKRRVRHAAANMFDLVADVEQLSRVRAAVPVVARAAAHAGRGGDRNRRRRHDGRLQGHARDFHQPGNARPAEPADPASNISTGRSAAWTIAGTSRPAAENVCDVEFFIAYEFKSRVLGMLMGAMFEAAFRRFAEAFERRADAIYGRVSTS